MVYIVLLNYNNCQDTIECLESLVSLKAVSYKIIIVDNYSSDDSLNTLISWVELRFFSLAILDEGSKDFEHERLCLSYDFNVEGLLKNICIYQAKINKGYSAGNNIGIRHAMKMNDATYIWLLNNDTVVKSDVLDKMLSAHLTLNTNKNKIGIVGCKLLYYYKPSVIQCLGGVLYNPYLGIIKQIGEGLEDVQLPAPHNVDKISYVPGTSMLVSIKFIKDVGLLSEEYFLYYEELDWVARGRRLGWECAYTTDSYVLHKVGGSISGNTSIKSKLSDYCFLRSKLLYTKKYENIICLSMIYIGAVGAIFKRLMIRQFDRIPTMIKILMNPKSSFFLP